MPRDPSRTRRIGALMRRELAALMRELSDTQAAKATITAIDVAPDLSHAKIFVTHLSGAQQSREILAALNKASPFLRRQLAGRIKLRLAPDLRFVYDESVERGMALSNLIDRARAQDKGEE